MSSNNHQPTFSIVIAVNDQADDLRTDLPTLLSQQYEGYELIVVDENSSDGSKDILKQEKEKASNLYTTFLPAYQFQKNRRRLAFTLGVKAAKNEWLVFTDLPLKHISAEWLSQLAEQTTDSTALILGYINEKKDSTKYRNYESIDEAMNLVRQAERWRSGIGHDRWMHTLKTSTRYDFIAVRKEFGHDLLKYYAVSPLRVIS